MLETVVTIGLIVFVAMLAWFLYECYYLEEEDEDDEMKKPHERGKDPNPHMHRPVPTPLHDWVCELDDRVQDQDEMIKKLIKQGARTMATVAEIKAELSAVKQAIIDEKAEVDGEFAAHQAQIQALKDQLANGTAVTAEDLDELLTAAKELRTGVADISTPTVPQ